eukprot:921806-Rhodomonas_salina.2
MGYARGLALKVNLKLARYQVNSTSGSLTARYRDTSLPEVKYRMPRFSAIRTKTAAKVNLKLARSRPGTHHCPQSSSGGNCGAVLRK